MLRYDLTDEDRAALGPHHRRVQAAIAVIANLNRGIDAEPEGIGKYEGGVKVDKCEIAIFANHVQDDWQKQAEPSLEEDAVVCAIRTVVGIFRRDGADGLRKFALPRDGDPLRSMLRLGSDAQ